MIVGFTGTQYGLTEAQRLALEHVFRRLRPMELHHGDCVGADAEAHQIVRLACPEVRRVIHPPSIARRRAYCEGESCLATLPYLQRNQTIVDACAVLVAAPGEIEEQQRSGTWSTVRAARRAGKTIWLVYPDGTMTEERPNG